MKRVKNDLHFTVLAVEAKVVKKLQSLNQPKLFGELF